MIDLETMSLKRESAIRSLDPEKRCQTCEYETTKEGNKPCNKCFCEMLYIPVNPTEWERKHD